MGNKKKLSSEQQKELLNKVIERFENIVRKSEEVSVTIGMR